MADSPFVTTEQVAEHFNVSLWTVRDWVKRGIIPPSAYIRVSKTQRFKLEAVEAALTQANPYNKEEPEETPAEEPVVLDGDQEDEAEGGYEYV